MPIMPIISEDAACPKSLPWELFYGCEHQAFRNHDQSLSQLASRGGLSPIEAYLILREMPLRDFRNVRTSEAISYLNQRLLLVGDKP